MFAEIGTFLCQNGHVKTKTLYERRISIPPIQVCRALSGGYAGCLCQWELKAPTDRSQSDCVPEQVVKADCKCPLYL